MWKTSFFSLQKFFGNKDFVKFFLKLTIPAILQQLISLLVVYIDNFMLASLLKFDGELAKTAVGLTNPIINFSIFFIVAWLSGTGVMISQYYGNKQFDKTREVLLLRLWMGFLLLIPVILVIVIIPGQLIQITSQASDTTQEFLYARIYLFISGFTLIPTLFSYSLNNAFIETKRQMISFFSALIGVITNIILDPIVIIIFRNDPLNAVAMVATTTLISRVVSFLYAFLYIYLKNDMSLNIFKKDIKFNPYNINFILDKKWKKFDKNTFKHVIKYSTPVFLNDAIYALAYLMLNICFLSFGHGRVDYHNAITNTLLIVGFVEIIWPGMGSAASIMIAAKLGEGKIEEAKENANKLLRWSFIIILVIIIFLFGCSWFINDILSPNNHYVIALSKRLEWIILPILLSQGMFSSLYFSIRSGGTKLIVFADCFVMIIWAIVMMILTFTNALDDCSLELFFFLLESNQLVKFVFACIIFKKTNWARNLTKDTLV